MAHGSEYLSHNTVVDQPDRDRVQVMELFADLLARGQRAQLPRPPRCLSPRSGSSAAAHNALSVCPSSRNSYSSATGGIRDALNTWSMEPDFAALEPSVHGRDNT